MYILCFSAQVFRCFFFTFITFTTQNRCFHIYNYQLFFRNSTLLMLYFNLKYVTNSFCCFLGISSFFVLLIFVSYPKQSPLGFVKFSKAKYWFSVFPTYNSVFATIMCLNSAIFFNFLMKMK